MTPSKDGRTIRDVRALSLVGRLRGKLPIQHVLRNWKPVLTVGRHLVLALLFDLQVQRFHQSTCAVTANLKTFCTQIAHHRATAQAVTRGGKQRFRALT